jgi:hypothetical protein
MAELAPWRVRCTVVSVAHNLGMALLLPRVAPHRLTHEFQAARPR